MQDTGNQNAAGFFPVKDNMLPLLHSPQSRTDFITCTAKPWAVGQKLTAILHLAEVAIRLFRAPGADGINADVEQIRLGLAGEAKAGHSQRGVCGR